MKKSFILWSGLLLSLASCQKSLNTVHEKPPAQPVTEPRAEITPAFTLYTIKAGEQFCDKNGFTPVDYQELKFTVRFDSSAIYQTTNPSNQADINKLFGFSDNNAQHHEFSARFGWRWSDKALRLFGYTYNAGERTNKEIGTVEIGKVNECSIKVLGDTYMFTLNDKTVSMPRSSKTSTAQGYKLYPYFGGDEMAPHEINIWIKE